MEKRFVAVLVAQGAMAGICLAGAIFYAANNHPFWAVVWLGISAINAAFNFRNIRRLTR